MTENRSEAAGLWAPPTVVVASQLGVFAVLAVLAWSNLNLHDEDPYGLWRVLGFAAALVSGLNLGVALCLHLQRRMVHQHMASQHPGVPVPSSRRS
jgi:hypothetical protein